MKVVEFLLSRGRFTRREFVDSVDARDPYALLRQLERWGQNHLLGLFSSG